MIWMDISMKRLSWAAFFLAGILAGAKSVAQMPESYSSLEGHGSCEAAPFVLPRSGKVREEAYSTVVLRDGISVFSRPSDQVSSSTLNFNTTVFILKAQDDQLLVQGTRRNAPVMGWVARKDLLCAKKPLKSTDGAAMRFYPVPEMQWQGEETEAQIAGQVYSDYRGAKCSAGGCRKLFAFNAYFVFEERNERYLLGIRPEIHRKTGLVGWVNKKSGFIWSGTHGMRPKERRRSACAYETLSDARNGNNCIPISGGTRWYKLPVRIPVLAKEEHFYRVWLPLSAIPVSGGFSDSLIHGYIPVASNNWQVDVLLTDEDFMKYERILQALIDIKTEPAKDFRQNFANALEESLTRILHKPLQERSGEPLEVILKHSMKLPVREDSPLFRYNFADFLNSRKMRHTQLARLQQWLRHVAEFFRIIQRGRHPVVFDDNGRRFRPDRLRYGTIDIIEGEDFSEKGVHYGQHTRQGMIYWVPQEFLP